MIVKILDTTGSWIVRTPSEVSMIECIELAEKLRVLIKNFHSREYRGGVVLIGDCRVRISSFIFTRQIKWREDTRALV
jgi:hypothetical protein